MSPPLPERNRDRHREATGRDVAAAQRILSLPPLGPPPGLRMPPEAWQALRLRVDHPDATHQELADLAGITRSTYSGRLRRALKAGGAS